jgi:hypothetical protein
LRVNWINLCKVAIPKENIKEQLLSLNFNDDESLSAMVDLSSVFSNPPKMHLHIVVRVPLTGESY